MKTNQKRSRLETVNVILSLSTNGIKKTHIMYKANMSHGQLEKYLEMLVSKGLLEKLAEFYNTTEKGLEFIKDFKKIQYLMEEDSSDAPREIRMEELSIQRLPRR